ncbi:MAG: T9SS type A sorting domain-containing protein [Cytophagales bacterium]
MKYLLFIMFLGLAFAQAQTNLSGTIQHGGLAREYRLYVPASYSPSKPAPLVLNLHGYTSNNLQQEFYGDFRAIADTAGFLLVHPNGTLDNNGNRFWNVGFFPSPIDDVGFLLALIDSISAEYNVNQQRVYSTGMSNGGFMSYELACKTARFAAVASVTGSITTTNFAQCSPSKPTPAMQIHGTADATVPYNGTATFLPVEDVVDYWVNFNNCNPTATFTAVPNTNTTDGATAEHYVYSGGDNNTSVAFYKVINGAHTWPGASFPIGTTCMDFSASKEIWRFFLQYALTTSLEKENDLLAFQLSPNPAETNCLLEWGTELSATIWVTDMQGRTIYTTQHQGSFAEIPVAHLSSGIYTLHIQSDKKYGYKRWVKK